MQNIRPTTLLISLLFLSACSTTVHKDFLQNFTKSQKTDGTFSRIVQSLVYNEKGKHLIVGHESGSIEIWDATKEKSMYEIKAHKNRANELAFSADGNAFFSNSMFETETKLWNVQTGELICSIPNTRGPVSATSDKRFYIIANSENLRIFDYKNKTLLPEEYKFTYGVIEAIAYDIATDQVAIGTQSDIQILKFSIIKGKPNLEKVSSVPGVGSIKGLQFSDNGHSLYSVSHLGSIDEWSTQPLKIKRSLPTALKHLYYATFTPDTGLLAMSGIGKQGYPDSPIGVVEIISLPAGLSSVYKMTTNYPRRIEFLSPFSSVISGESYSMEVYPIPQGK